MILLNKIYFVMSWEKISGMGDSIDFDTGHCNDWLYFVVGVYIIGI